MEENVRQLFDNFLNVSLTVSGMELEKMDFLLEREKNGKIGEINEKLEVAYEKKNLLELELQKLELFDRSVDRARMEKQEKHMRRDSLDRMKKSEYLEEPKPFVKEYSSSKYGSFADNLRAEKKLAEGGNFSTIGDFRSKLLGRLNKLY